jgi:hypothetical protein
MADEEPRRRHDDLLAQIEADNEALHEQNLKLARELAEKKPGGTKQAPRGTTTAARQVRLRARCRA